MDNSKLELILLGTGTCVPSIERNASGYVVRYNDLTIILDIGNGILRRMLEANVDYKDVDAICLSHFHPDHVTDLVSFLFATRHTPGFTRTKELIIIGPVGLRDFLDKLSAVYGEWILHPNFSLQIIELESSEIEISPLSIKTARANHSEESIAYRITEPNGGSITYSGDTDECESIVELARGTDILVIECSFPNNNKIAGHLTPAEVGKIARASQCKQVVLTHIYPVHETDPTNELREIFDGKVTLGRDLMEFQV